MYPIANLLLQTCFFTLQTFYLVIECVLLSHSGAVEPPPTNANMWIAVSTTAVVVFIGGLLVGVLAGILLYHCVIKHQAWNSKLESSSHKQKIVSSSNPLQQTGPQYEEVLELKQNKAYETTQTGIEMRPNEAYGPTQH